MALTQESILSFLLERGGKVKNSELLNHFRSQISCSDPAEKQHNRDLFKKLVNSVAVVKQIDEVKYVVVKKRYLDFVREVVKNELQKSSQVDDSFSSQNTSFSCASPTHRAESERRIYSDIENNNLCCPSNSNDNCYSDAKYASVGSVQDRAPLSPNSSGPDTATLKVVNISGDQASKAGKSGAVFAVIAVKSPPREPAPETQDGCFSQVHQTNVLVTKVSKPSMQNRNFPAGRKDAQSEAGDKQHPVFPHVRPSIKTTRQGDDAKYSESVPLEALAHEWLVKCAAGLWGQIHGLLLQDTRLVQKKDFMSGFTALHWAAKDGSSDMIHKLVNIPSKRGTYVNINCKAHGGYTPLHIAAIHSHSDVIVLLVQRYGANVNVRDNDGKKAVHYLGKGVSAEVRALLGAGQPNKNKKTEDEDYREQPRSFNTISKLFQPHMGKKQRTSTRYAQDW
ncbi:ankyrin repeat domain-containing protein SOWAHB [Xyrichtys novacula]|uniref:Ankyrin repeat domain-containing protein SOWAHB n=1 Tax=Xyrichtys novacula TaxID=13765 RepID=A0AAV1FBK7_XYRNO|nr:ankyrin repeat domain-containing protein SOWAHB [Xyrichtys novacula]